MTTPTAPAAPTAPTAPTIYDVARTAGVSIASVSRVLNGRSATVSPDYARRVVEAASTLRYTADVPAQAMRRRSDAIALIADAVSPAVNMVLSAMERQARTVDAFVSVTGPKYSRE